MNKFYFSSNSRVVGCPSMRGTILPSVVPKIVYSHSVKQSTSNEKINYKTSSNC